MSETTHTPWLADDCTHDVAEPGIAIIASDTVDRISNPTRGMVAWVGLTGANFNAPETARANAALIVRAVNCHAELVAALLRADQFISNGIGFGYIRMPTMASDPALQTPAIIRAALAKAAP